MMLVFWLAVAGMLALALVLLVPVLLRGPGEILDTTESENLALARERLLELEQAEQAGEMSEEDFTQARQELEDQLAADIASQPASTRITKQGRGLIGGLLVVLPLLSVLLYQYLGNPELMESNTASSNPNMPADHPAVADNGQPLPSVDVMVARLAERMQQQPDNIQGWHMLARSYMSLERYPEAAAAYEQLLQRVGDDPNIMVAYADALAMTRSGDIDDKSLALIEQALALEPDHPTALWLSGVAYRQQGRNQQAVDQWLKARTVLANDPASVAELDTMIASAQQAMDQTPDVSDSDTTGDAAELPPIVSAKIAVTVVLDDAFRDQVTPDDTVFILARAVDGPPMPLAVVKKQVKDLPITVVLDDSQAMMPSMKLSQFDEVVVVARVSISGAPIAQSGDLQGIVQSVQPGIKSAVSLKIDQLIP